jgi:hypothetical protein
MLIIANLIWNKIKTKLGWINHKQQPNIHHNKIKTTIKIILRNNYEQ